MKLLEKKGLLSEPLSVITATWGLLLYDCLALNLHMFIHYNYEKQIFNINHVAFRTVYTSASGLAISKTLSSTLL
jgi:hypothetical protein